MTFDYADLAATAVELLADFGMAMTLARPTDIPATYDTATGVATPVGPDTYTVTGIKLDYSVREIDSVAQGFNQIQAGSAEYDWGVTPGDLATIWRGGCIIRAKFLNRIKEAFDDDPDLPTLIVAPYFRSAIEAAIDRIGLERHRLSGLAQDIGSAAVLLSFVLLAVVWALVLLDRWGVASEFPSCRAS
mgnify:CR=1 FL=1